MSFDRWRRVPGLARALFARPTLVLAQSEADGERLAALGARRVEQVPGDNHRAVLRTGDGQIGHAVRRDTGELIRVLVHIGHCTIDL